MSAPRERPSSPEGAVRATYGVVRSLPFEGDEAALVAALRAGRADAAAALYDRHARMVHALTFRLMGPDGEIDDVVHDVFVRALESLPRLRDPSALRSWLLGIAVRVVGIRFQKRSRQRWLRFMSPEDVPEEVSLPATEMREVLRHVYEILGTMKTDERVAFVLDRVDGMRHEDAARAMGTSLATFRRRLASAEAKFFARARRYRSLDGWLEPDGGAT